MALNHNYRRFRDAFNENHRLNKAELPDHNPEAVSNEQELKEIFKEDVLTAKLTSSIQKNLIEKIEATPLYDVLSDPDNEWGIDGMLQVGRLLSGMETDLSLDIDPQEQEKIHSLANKYFEQGHGFSKQDIKRLEMAVKLLHAQVDQRLALLQPEKDLEAVEAVSTAPSFSESYANLKDAKVTTPEWMRREKAWVTIGDLQHVENGLPVYQSLQEMADIKKSITGRAVSHVDLWKDLHGIMSRGGVKTLSFKEVCKDVLGIRTKLLFKEGFYDNLDPSKKAEIDRFMTAAQRLFDTMESVGDTELSRKEARADREERYREMIEVQNDSESLAELGPDFANMRKTLINAGFSPTTSLFLHTGRRKHTMDNTESDDIYDGISNEYIFQTFFESGIDSFKNESGRPVANLERFAAELNEVMQLGADTLEESGEWTPVNGVELTNNPHNFTDNEKRLLRHGFTVRERMRLRSDQVEQKEHLRETYGPIMDELFTRLESDYKLELSYEEKVQIAESVQVKTLARLGVMNVFEQTQDGLQWQRADWGIQVPIVEGISVAFGHAGADKGQWYIVNAGAVGVGARVAIGETVELAGAAAVRYVDGFGIDLGGQAKVQLGKESAYSIVAGGGLDIGLNPNELAKLAIGGSIGVKRDIGWVLAKKTEALMEEDKEVFAEQHNKVQDFVNGQFTELTDGQRQAMIHGAMEVVEDIYRKEGVDSLSTLQWTGAGLAAGVSLDAKKSFIENVKDSAQTFSAYVSFTVAKKDYIVFSRPKFDPSGAIEADLMADFAARVEEDPTFYMVEVPGPILVDRSRGEKAIAQARIDARELQKADFENTQFKVGPYGIELIAPTGDQEFPELKFHGIRGNVRLVIDKDLDLPLMAKADGTLEVDLKRLTSFVPVIVTEKTPLPRGLFTSHTTILLTNNANLNENDVMSKMEEAGTYLQWTQNYAGRKSPMREHGSSDAILSDAESIADYAELVDGDYSEGGLNSWMEEVQVAKTIVNRFRRKELFKAIESDTEHKNELIDFALNFLKLNPSVDYEALAMDGTLSNQTLSEMIHAEWNKQEGVLPLKNAEVIYIRQVMMEEERPDQISGQPAKFNRAAFAQMLEQQAGMDAGPAEASAELFMQYYIGREKELADRNDGFPEGSAFVVHIDDSGEIKLVRGYYDKSVHGKVLGPIEWNHENPEKTLQTMGLENTAANQELVRQVATAVEEVTRPQFFVNPEQPTFDEALTTSVGGGYLAAADHIYGSRLGKTLRSMAENRNTSADPVLAEEFANDIAALMRGETITKADGELKVHVETTLTSGLYEACYNLAHARVDELVVEGSIKEGSGPAEKQVAAYREQQADYLVAEFGVNFKEVAIGVAAKRDFAPDLPTEPEPDEPSTPVIPPKPGGGKNPAAAQGTGGNNYGSGQGNNSGEETQ